MNVIWVLTCGVEHHGQPRGGLGVHPQLHLVTRPEDQKVQTDHTIISRACQSPRQPDVLLAKLDGEWRSLDLSILAEHGDDVVGPGEEVVVGDDGGVEGGEEERSEHRGRRQLTDMMEPVWSDNGVV